MTFIEQQKEYIDALETAFPAYLPQSEHKNDVVDAMRYSLLSGGKRVRAVLLLSSYAMLAKDFRTAVPFAAAIEMVHAYSLIHDDLPCMDDDDMRRGKPACHIAYGEATALLAGDGLLTLAFETLTRDENIETFGAKKLVDAVAALSRAAGVNGMIGGQMLDLENEDRDDVTAEMLVRTDGKKTGALIKCACEIGCILGGADEKTTAHVLEYAFKLGLAFQIQDDILDVEGDPDKLGKPTGSDVGRNKPTYASLYGIGKAKEIARQLTDDAVRELAETGLEAEFLCGLAKNLANRKY